MSCARTGRSVHDMKYIDKTRMELHYTLPLNEIIYDFFDALKSRAEGYASLDYELKGYSESKACQADILREYGGGYALSFIVHSDKAMPEAEKIVESLRDNIPRQLLGTVQAAVAASMRGDSSCASQGLACQMLRRDINKERKLLEKQKEGKKRMQARICRGSAETFMACCKLEMTPETVT